MLRIFQKSSKRCWFGEQNGGGGEGREVGLIGLAGGLCIQNKGKRDQG